MNLREEAKKLLLKNYSLTGSQYIAPDSSRYHTDQWLWDSCFHAIVCAELGMKDLAKNEIERLLPWQSEDGWIPHQIYKKQHLKWPTPSNLERLFYKNESRKFHSSITQPPVMAQAVEAIDDQEWTQKILPKLIKFYLYFIQKRDPDMDGLISICHPCEARDTAPDFDFRRDFNIIGFFFSLLKLERQYKKLDWDITEIWRKNLFNVEDLMFNCIWIDGLRSLSRLIMACGYERKSAEYIKNLADMSEAAIYKLCWDEKDRVLRNLDSQNRQIKQLTISNLFPLILDNIPETMSKALIEHLQNPEEFWTPHPIPSVAKNNPAFDPDSGFYCNWRGPTWINMNWFIVRGLVKHGYHDIAGEIAEKTREMIEREGFREFYNPLTGKGLRNSTKGFGWSTLVITFPKILKEKQRPE